MSTKLSATELYAFQTITDFVSSLHEIFGRTKHTHSRALSLYYRLIIKTSITNKKVIKRHLKGFREFCEENRNSLAERSALSTERIEFSDKIYLHIPYFLKNSNDDTSDTIWEYILTISALLDPVGKAKDILSKIQQTVDIPHVEPVAQPDMSQMMSMLMGAAGGGGGGGGDMLSAMGPMVSQMMNNPGFSDLVSNVTQTLNTSGTAIPDINNLDMPGLMGSMNKIMGTVAEQLENSTDPNIKNLLQLANSVAPQPDDVGGSNKMSPPPVIEEL